MWALGVAAYTLLTAARPFNGACDRADCLSTQDWLDCAACDRLLHADIRRAHVTFPAWPRVSAPAQDFVRRLLAADPAARPTARQAARHAFLTRRPDPEWRLTRSLAVLRESYCVHAKLEPQLFPPSVEKQGSGSTIQSCSARNSDSDRSNVFDTTFLNDSASYCELSTFPKPHPALSTTDDADFIEVMQTPGRKSLRSKAKSGSEMSTNDKLKIARFAVAHGMSLPPQGIRLPRTRQAGKAGGVATGGFSRVKRRILGKLQRLARTA